jgi:hypothetical protein
MEFRDLFSQTIKVEQPAEKGEPVAAGKRKTEREGVFVSAQTIVTFPVMSGLVTGAWASIERGFQLEHNLWVGLILSLIAGVFLFFEHETDPKKPSDSRRFVRIGVAIANTLVLFFAASGFYSWTAH